MWTAEGRTKSVHNSEVSTLVKLGLATGHTAHDVLSYWENQTGREKSVHNGGVSTVVGCPQGEVLLYSSLLFAVRGRTDRQTDGRTDGRYQVHYLPCYAVDKHVKGELFFCHIPL